MNNKEILSELTQSYRFLNDISENGCLDKKAKKGIKKAKNYLEEVYSNFYDTLNKEELEIKNFYHKENEKIYISNVIDFGYDSYIDNKYDSSLTCEDTDYFWYEDLSFIYGRKNVKIKLTKEERK